MLANALLHGLQLLLNRVDQGLGGRGIYGGHSASSCTSCATLQPLGEATQDESPIIPEAAVLVMCREELPSQVRGAYYSPPASSTSAGESHRTLGMAQRP